MAVHRLAATTPPLGKILTADEIARFVARVGYPAGPVVLVGEELALAAPAGAYGDWLGALGLPDLAEKARTLLPESTVVSTMTVPRPGPSSSAVRVGVFGEVFTLPFGGRRLVYSVLRCAAVGPRGSVPVTAAVRSR